MAASLTGLPVLLFTGALGIDWEGEPWGRVEEDEGRNGVDERETAISGTGGVAVNETGSCWGWEGSEG